MTAIDDKIKATMERSLVPPEIPLPNTQSPALAALKALERLPSAKLPSAKLPSLISLHPTVEPSASVSSVAANPSPVSCVSALSAPSTTENLKLPPVNQACASTAILAEPAPDILYGVVPAEDVPAQKQLLTASAHKDGKLNEIIRIRGLWRVVFPDGTIRDYADKQEAVDAVEGIQELPTDTQEAQKLSQVSCQDKAERFRAVTELILALTKRLQDMEIS